MENERLSPGVAEAARMGRQAAEIRQVAREKGGGYVDDADADKAAVLEADIQADRLDIASRAAFAEGHADEAETLRDAVPALEQLAADTGDTQLAAEARYTNYDAILEESNAASFRAAKARLEAQLAENTRKLEDIKIKLKKEMGGAEGE